MTADERDDWIEGLLSSADAVKESEPIAEDAAEQQKEEDF
jgi:hypothetical protein